MKGIVSFMRQEALFIYYNYGAIFKPTSRPPLRRKDK